MKPQCKVFGKAGTRKRTRSRFASLLHPSHGPLHFVASHSRVSLAFRARLYGKYEEPEGGSGQSLDSVKKEKSVLSDIQKVTFAGGEMRRTEIGLRSQANIQTPMSLIFLAMIINISLDIIKDR